MDKKAIRLISVLTAAVISVNAFSACSRSRTGSRSNEPVKEVTLLTDDSIMDRYMKAVEDYDKVEYEQVVWTTARGDGIGPHDYRFRGIVYLSDEEAQRLWDEYEWNEVTDPEFEFDKVNTSPIGDGPWYRCSQFEKDNNSIAMGQYILLFDGNNLVFDMIQT